MKAFVRTPHRFLRATVTGALGLAAIGLLPALVVGHVTPMVVALAAVCIARLTFDRRDPSGAGTGQRDAAFIMASLLIIYLANGRTLPSGDTVPARYLPLAILREGNFYLDAFRFLHAECVPYYLTLVGGHYVSAYPVGAALLALPFYAPAALAGVSAESPVVEELEKLAAAAIVALSAILLFHAARLLASRRMALFVTAAYALGSSSLSVSSQALWQHGPSQLGFAGALYCLLRGRRQPSWAAVAGLPLAFAMIARPTDALIAAPVAVYILRHHPRQFPGFALAATPPIAFHLWYNLRYFSDPLRTQWSLLDGRPWATSFWDGLAGLVLSPGRGLLVYSPIFALSAVGFLLAWRRGGDPLLRSLSVGTGLALVLYAKWEMWWGGFTFGPRLLADLLPALALGLCPLEAPLARHRALAVIAAALLAWSVGAHAVGAFAHDYYWNAYADVDRYPARLWSWTDNQLVNPVRHALGRAAVLLARRPTSRTAPKLVVAAYSTPLPPPQSVATSSPLEMSLTAANEGRATWLARPRGSDGVMALAWRWRRAADSTVIASGSLRLYHDVAPGHVHNFRLRLEPPRAPGAYVLELGLTSARAGCDSPIDSPSPAWHVAVTPPQGAGSREAGASPGPRRCAAAPLPLSLPVPCASAG